MLTNQNDWPVDPEFGSIVEALSPQSVLPTLRAKINPEARTCRAIEAMYDPGLQIRVAYTLLEDENRRNWPDGDVCYLRYPVRHPMSRRGEILEIGGFSMEFYRFPNDRRLRGLRKFASRIHAAQTWQRWLSEDETSLELQPETLRRDLLRYVPEQKWIAFLQAKCIDNVAEQQVKRAIAVRSADSDDCRSIHARLVALRRARHASGGLFRVPKPVALDTRLGLSAVRWVWGDSLLDILGTGDVSTTMEYIATGLQSFHHTRMAGLPVQLPSDQFISMTRCAEDIGAAMPDLRNDLRTMISALRSSIPDDVQDTQVTLHNDFHPMQLRGRPGRLTLLDLERCANGDRWVDVASFAAQLSALPIRSDCDISESTSRSWAQSFLNAWESSTGVPVNIHRIRWYSALAFLTFARGMLRHLRPGWEALARGCVDRALECAHLRDDLEILT